MLEPNIQEKIWDSAHYWTIRLHWKVAAIGYLCWRLQRAMYYKWAKHYQARCEAEWALQDASKESVQ